MHRLGHWHQMSWYALRPASDAFNAAWWECSPLRRTWFTEESAWPLDWLLKVAKYGSSGAAATEHAFLLCSLPSILRRSYSSSTLNSLGTSKKRRQHSRALPLPRHCHFHPLGYSPLHRFRNPALLWTSALFTESWVHQCQFPFRPCCLSPECTWPWPVYFCLVSASCLLSSLQVNVSLASAWSGLMCVCPLCLKLSSSLNCQSFSAK